MEITKEEKLQSQKIKRYTNPLSAGIYRNKPCMCGSGKKTKKCHGKDSSMNQEQYNEMNEYHKKQFGKPMGRY